MIVVVGIRDLLAVHVIQFDIKTMSLDPGVVYAIEVV
jgi:hypothetical protein